MLISCVSVSEEKKNLLGQLGLGNTGSNKIKQISNTADL